MQIAIVNRHASDVLGGSEIQCDNIATGLQNRGHFVTYIAPGGTQYKDYNRTYCVKPVEPTGKSIAKAVLTSNPDVVYWRLNRYMLFQAARIISSHHIPIVFAVSHIRDTQRFQHTSNMNTPKGLIRAAKELLTNAYNYAGFKYVSAATSLNPDFLGLLPISHQVHVPNSVTMDSVPFSWPRPYVVWIANLKAAKRPELFVRLAARLERTGVDFLMFGQIQAEEYNNIGNEPPSNFHYLGPCTFEESNGVISGSLLLAHTCRPEGFGNNFIQAWLAGKPTVSLGFDPGGYIEQEKLGGFAHDDFESFVSIIEALLCNDAERQEVGTRARTFAEANFSVQRTVDTLEKVLDDVVHRRTTNAKR